MAAPPGKFLIYPILSPPPSKLFFLPAHVPSWPFLHAKADGFNFSTIISTACPSPIVDTLDVTFTTNCCQDGNSQGILLFLFLF